MLTVTLTVTVTIMGNKNNQSDVVVVVLTMGVMICHLSMVPTVTINLPLINFLRIPGACLSSSSLNRAFLSADTMNGSGVIYHMMTCVSNHYAKVS